MDSEARRVAEGLTEAQRRAVVAASWSEARGAWHSEGWYCAADKRVRYNLSRKGLARDYLRPSNHLTPLGLRVRAVLQESNDGRG